jgi:hypothetical protein
MGWTSKVRVQFPVLARDSLLFLVSVLFLGCVQPSFSVDGRGCCSGVEADPSFTLSIKVKLVWSCISTPNMSSWHGS